MSISLNGIGRRRALRPSSKVPPEQAREHNRALVLQTAFTAGPLSRADIARITGLARVTVGHLIDELRSEGLVVEIGTRVDARRPGKPATLVDIDRGELRIVGVDLGARDRFRAAVFDVDGNAIERCEIESRGLVGASAVAAVIELVQRITAVADRPILGIGIGSPGTVDSDGVVLAAPNRGWHHLSLRKRIQDAAGIPVVIANDADVAVLAEFAAGVGSADLMLVLIGEGVGAGLLIDGVPVVGSRFAAGEIGHIVVEPESGKECRCGKGGCLETWLGDSPLRSRLAAGESRIRVLNETGERLGSMLAPIIGTLDLREVVLAGPRDLLEGPLLDAAARTVRERTLTSVPDQRQISLTALGDDIVLRGAAILLLSSLLGVS